MRFSAGNGLHLSRICVEHVWPDALWAQVPVKRIHRRAHIIRRQLREKGQKNQADRRNQRPKPIEPGMSS